MNTAITDKKKARLFDLAASVLELTRDGKRDIEQVSKIFQIIKNQPDFYGNLLGNKVVNKAEIFPIWKSITIGGKSSEQLLMKLEKGNFIVSDWAKDLINKPAFTTWSNPVEISLVRIKVRDLGFTVNPTTTQFFSRAKEMGLALCPAEVGPHLRLVFNNQSLGDCFWIAMEPICASDGRPNVFYVERDDSGDRWLRTGRAYPEGIWDIGCEFVFSRQAASET